MEGWTPVGILQLLCGVWFIPHIVGKSMNYHKAADTFVAAGFRPGRVFVGITIALEIVACVGLVTGLYVSIASLAGVVVLLGASYAVVKINGFNWRWQKMGPEFPIFWALVCIIAGFA